MKKKNVITVNSEKCTCCLVCTMHCSHLKQGVYNPVKAYIRISNCQETPSEVSFTDDCDGCGICAHYCPYGCLVLMKHEKDGTLKG